MVNRHRKKGSVLLIATLFSAFVAALVAIFLKLALGELKLADSSYMHNALLNLCEGGAEQAAWCLNADDWSGWTKSGEYTVRRETEIGLGNGKQGQVTMIVFLPDTFPIIFAEARVNLPNGRTLQKQVRMELLFRSPFANGMTAKDGIRFVGGNAYVDSFHSALGPYYSATRRDNGSVGSVSVGTDSVDIGNAEIFGFAATGGADPAVGSQGRIVGFDTPPGVKIDSNRVSTDFYAEFPNVDAPSTLGATTSLPGTLEIGSPLATSPTVYSLSGMIIKNTKNLVIKGPVVIVVDGDIDVKGQITLEPGATVEMYVSGDLTIGGKGVVNETNVSQNFLIVNTNTTEGATEVKLHGQGALTAAVYAPNSIVDFKGGGGGVGTMYGAVVGQNVFMNGNYNFHYDEALADFLLGKRTFRLADWREIWKAEERIDFDGLYESALAGSEIDMGEWIARVVPIPPSPPAFIPDHEEPPPEPGPPPPPDI